MVKEIMASAFLIFAALVWVPFVVWIFMELLMVKEILASAFLVFAALVWIPFVVWIFWDPD